ncbi:MAG: hypothetical protein J0M29_16380 [Chitinophagales bacterium]|nr:hypothetical protein [Chitinophagales bacterium]
MDFQKAKIYLDKLHREFNRMSKDQENIVRLDVDILASYVRELYDAILSEANTSVPAPKPEPAPARVAPPAPTPVVEVVKETPPPPPPPVVEEVPAPPPPPVVEAPPPPPPPVVQAPPPPPPPVEVEKPAPAVKVSPPAAAGAGLDLLFEEKQAKELSEKLAESAIADLKKAIALNDRLLYTSELFAGDGKAFENALNALNDFSHFDQARDYLIHNYVVHYTWTDKKRLDTAKAFVKLVRRRYK